MHLQHLLFSTVDILFFIELFKYKQINHGIIFHCHNNQNVKHIHKIFNHHSILVSSTKLNGSQYKIPKSYQKIGIVLHGSCDGWTSAFNVISFERTMSWIIMTENLFETTDALANYPIEADSDVTVAHKIENSSVLYEVYNTGTHYKGTFIVRHIGYWNPGFNIAMNDRRDLRGAEIKISVVSLRTDHIVDETFEHYIDEWMHRVKADSVHRFKYYTLLKYLRDMYNISFYLQRVDSWGYIRNGSFDGVVGALFHGDGEIGGSPVFFRADRALYLQYVAEVWHSRNCFIFRHPKYPGGFYTIYKRPLSDAVWYCCISLLTVTGLVLWIAMKIKSGDDSTLSLAMLTIWGAFCQQGSCIQQQASSVKLVLFTTFLCALTIYQYYNATIVSSLLLDPPKNIRTLRDLLHSDLKVGVDDVLYNRDYFKRTEDPVAIELYNKKIATATHQNFLSGAEGMALVKKGGFAFHVETTLAFPIIKETFTEAEICDTTTVQLYPLQKLGVVVRRSSPYKEYVVNGIRRVFEAGLAARVQSVADTPMAQCVRTPDASVFRVDILEFSLPLLALAAGLALALAVFTCELLVASAVVDRSFVEFTH